MKCPGNGCCLYSMFWTVNPTGRTVQLNDNSTTVKSSPHASAFASVINLASATSYWTAVSIGLIRVKINL